MLESFQLRAWVKLGPKYQLKEMIQSILAQVSPQVDKTLLEEIDGRSLDDYLYQSLKGNRYLIVLDDVWNKSVWDDMKRLFPDNNNTSLVLVTTRLQRLAHPINSHKIRFLSKEESWDLLREKVFGQESCPRLLEEAGKKIAERCEGLPLTIVTVGNLLSNVNKTPENWNKVAEYQNSLLDDAYEQVTNVLFPSYNYLDQCSKACFLYMGSFPQNYEISCSELIKLWSADILFDQNVNRPEVLIMIEDLVYNSLLIPGPKSSTIGIKTWSLHTSFWHLCKREAWKNKFFHVINSYADGLSECIKGQRRLCIHNNILFGIKDVYNSMASISTRRSLICTSPPHQYPVPICFSLKLLRILNVLTIRFYEFPMEVMKLIQLRYLALTFYGNFPCSISKFLWNLQYLIVCRHMDIKSFGAPSYLPMEIWNMKELKHLQIMGSNLPDPCSDTLLPNLITLLDVGPHSCTKGVFGGIPNLEKLGIRIELVPNASESFGCFDHISLLENLKSLKCVIVNPIFGPEVVAPPPLWIFPSRLEKLSLSGFGYPWDDMRMIASLPNLKVLKLRCYAFRGPNWQIEENGFPKLKFLLIEDTDMVQWTMRRRGSIPEFLFVYLKSCYKLEKIHLIANYLTTIELVDCNPLAVACAQQMKDEGFVMSVNVHSSLDDQKLGSKG
ncbi:hypothetical protein DH2020_013143 [Rehmannia glutinosa]|uniref:NB-ARC domain-containing protein n=1 Tax=Rehmannia glutinosa TaxID=99300 RepID=A0ABR0X255_REHGL